MKIFGFICFLVVCSFGFAQKPDAFGACNKNAKSQQDLQSCADQEAKRVDADLDRIYHQLLGNAKSDPVAVEKIEAAQRAWTVFRDAHIKAMYPHEDRPGEYGTSYPMCVLLLKTELTRERAKMLSKMLNPVEGEVCDAGLRYQSSPESSAGAPDRP